MPDYNFPADLVDKEPVQLLSLSTATRIPYEVLVREWNRRQNAKAEKEAADAKAAADLALTMLEAERQARTFADADDALMKCGFVKSTKATGPVNGPWVKEQLDGYAAFLQQQARDREEFLRPLAEHFGWHREYTARRSPESMRAEAAASATYGTMILGGKAKDWTDAKRRYPKVFLAWLPPTINRFLSKHGKHKP